MEDRSLTCSPSTSGSLEPMIPSRTMPTYLQLFFEMMIFRNSIRNGTEFYYQWRKSHLMNTRVWETQDRIGKNFEARNGNSETNAAVKNQETKQREQRIHGDCWQWKSNGQCSKGDNCSFRHDFLLACKIDTAESVNQKSQRQKSQWKNVSTLQGVPQRNLHQFILWKVASSRMLVPQVREWMQIWGKVLLCASPGWRTVQQKVSKEWWQKCSGHAENYTTIGLRIPGYGAAEDFIDFSEELKKYGNQSDGFNSQKPTYVMLTFETKIHRLTWFAQVNLISGAPMLQILRIGLRKRRNGKSDVPVKQRGGWPKKFQKLKEKNKATVFSPSENWCLPAANLKLQERESVVDSGASMHMISKKDLNSAEMDTLTTSTSPTIVIPANGEVQTHEEATVYVKELDIFLTLSPREHASSILARKALRCTRILLWVDQGSKTPSHWKRY